MKTGLIADRQVLRNDDFNYLECAILYIYIFLLTEVVVSGKLN